MRRNFNCDRELALTHHHLLIGIKGKGTSMDDTEQTDYYKYVRGAATFILLGKENPPIASPELAQLYQLDLEMVNADIDAIVQFERHKVGGVFEAK